MTLIVAKALIKKAEEYLRNHGMKKVQGPVNPSINYECGTLIDGFEDPPSNYDDLQPSLPQRVTRK